MRNVFNTLFCIATAVFVMLCSCGRAPHTVASSAKLLQIGDTSKEYMEKNWSCKMLDYDFHKYYPRLLGTIYKLNARECFDGTTPLPAAISEKINELYSDYWQQLARAKAQGIPLSSAPLASEFMRFYLNSDLIPNIKELLIASDKNECASLKRVSQKEGMERCREGKKSGFSIPNHS